MKAVPDQIARWVPAPFTTLGTDGFGRSDTRAALRRHFETDAAHVVVAVLDGLRASRRRQGRRGRPTPSAATASTRTARGRPSWPEGDSRPCRGRRRRPTLVRYPLAS